MKIFRIVAALFVIVAVRSAYCDADNVKIDNIMLIKPIPTGAQDDTLPLYPNPTGAFDPILLHDTVDAGSGNYPVYPKADTGDTFSGEYKPYLNWDYQFTNGWAASKLLWNYGQSIKDIYPNAYGGASFLFDHDSLVFYYKGPLSSQNMTVFFGASGGCGGGINYYKVGTVPSASSWKRASLALPDSVDTIQGIRELDFVIHDVAGITPPAKEKNKCGCGTGTGLALLPPIWFKVMSNRKRKKKSRAG